MKLVNGFAPWQRGLFSHINTTLIFVPFIAQFKAGMKSEPRDWTITDKKFYFLLAVYCNHIVHVLAKSCVHVSKTTDT